MLVIKKEPTQYEATQFNKEGDFPNVKRGYAQTKGNFVSLFISDSYPRSMDCRFCYVLASGSCRHEIKIGDWILTDTKKENFKIVSAQKFHKKYTEAVLIKMPNDSEATK